MGWGTLAFVGRPGWPNSISYPYTGIFTQPLENKGYDCPLPMEVPYPCSALNTSVKALIFLSTKVGSEAIGRCRFSPQIRPSPSSVRSSSGRALLSHVCPHTSYPP